MGATKQTIVIDTKIQATLTGMDKIVSDLKRGLGEGATKIDLTKGVGNSLSKSISKFKEEYDKFSRLTKDGQLDFLDSKEAVHSGEQMVKIFKELQRVVGNFEELTLFDAKKMFPQAFDSRVNELQKKLGTFQEALSRLQAKEIDLNAAKNSLQELQQEQQVLQNSLKAEIAMQVDTTKVDEALEKSKKKIQELRNELKASLSQKLDTAENTITSSEARIDTIKQNRQSRGAMSKPTLAALGKQATEEQKSATREAIRLYEQEQKEIEELTKKMAAAKKEAKELRMAYAEADNSDLKDLAVSAGASSSKIDEVTTALKNEEKAAEEAKNAHEKLEKSQQNAQKIQTNIDKTTKAIEEQQEKVNRLKAQYELLEKKLDSKGFSEAFSELGINFSPEMLKNTEDVKKLQQELKKLSEADLRKLIQSLQKMGLSSREADNFVEGLKQELMAIDDSADDISRAAKEMENLKRQILNFFSITNVIQLFKRIVQSALNTVKELDATMTEAAVVTDFSIGDMWDQLPKYSEEAQKLGVSINGMYQATTLYYQQGLKTNEAMQLGVETMKMAKIASMDSTEATTAMTAALRGFNMELNEMSATRVNDVYSQLAAITAADTNQIATAMEKTASIAASANMEFETTAALLAQIIETTQEAPETAGTALKTIIARFSEVKSLASQGLVSGQDSEGEVIDVNKIQTALRTVGISMNEYFAGTEGLDDVLLRLSEKWGTLDFETQRYIATMAAGSRQQSRFIAMMSDYGRTQELVAEANNSAGVSEQQFQKTQESLASSITKLKNAWDQFTMSLANNEILKFGVEFLTRIIETVNKLTDRISGGNGLIKSVVNLLTVISAIKGASGMLSKAFSKVAPSFGLTKKKNPEKPKEKQTPTQKQEEKRGYENGKAYRKGWDRGRVGKKEKEPVSSKESKEISKTGEAASEGASQVENFNGEIEKTGQKVGVTAEQINAGQVALGKLSSGFTIAGSACMGLAAVFQMIGLEEAADAASTIGVILVGIGGTISLISGLLPTLATAQTAAGVAGAIAGGMTATSWTAAGTAIWTALAPLLPLIGMIVLAIGAIIAVIMLLSHIVKKSKENSLEGQMKAAAEATQNAKAAAEEAKKAYEDFLGQHNEYNKTQEALDNLTRGTEEWTQALLEANNKVLELIQTYPELAQYMSRGEHGQLIITEEGWNKEKELRKKGMKNTAAAVFASQLKETKLKEKKAKQDLQNKAIQEGITYLNSDTNTMQADQKDLDTIHQKYKELGPELFNNSTALQELAIATGQTVDEILAMKDSIIEYDNSLQQLDMQAKAQAEGMLMSQISDETAAYEYSKQAVAAIAGGVVQGQADKEKEITSKLYSSDGKSESKNNQYFKDLAKEYGLSEKDFTGKDKEDLETLYAKMAGISKDEIAEGLKGNKQELAKEIAKLQASKEYGQQTDKLAKSMSKLDPEKQRTYAAFLSKDTSTLKKSDIGSIGKITADTLATDLGYKSAQELAELLGYTDTKDETGKVTATAAQKLEATMKKSEEAIQKTLSKIYKDSTAYMGYSAERLVTKYEAAFGQELDINQTRQLVNSFKEIELSGGDSESLINFMPDLIAGLSGDELQQAMNLLTTASWDTTAEIDGTVSALKELGVSIDEDLIKSLYRATNAIYKFDIAAVEEKFKNLSSLVDLVEGKAKEKKNTYTTEEMNKLISAGIAERSSFKRVGYDEFISLQPIEELLKEIANNTSYLRTSASSGLQKNVAVGRAIETAMNDSGTTFNVYSHNGGTSGNTSQDYDASKKTTKEVIAMLQQGTLDAWGIGGRTNIGRKDLEQLAGSLGLDPTQMIGLDDSSLIDLILEQWSSYYGVDGSVLKKNEKDLETEGTDLVNWNQMATAGTEDFYKTIYRPLGKRGTGTKGTDTEEDWMRHNQADWMSNVQEYYRMTAPGDTKSYIGYTYDIDYDKLLEDIKNNPDFVAKYSNVFSVTEAMRDMVAEFGFSGAEDMQFDELYSILNNIEDASAAEENLDALIQSQAGLKYAVDNTSEALTRQNSEVASDSLAIKNLVWATQKQNSIMSDAGTVLEENTEILEEGAEGTLRYAAALENISKAMSLALGVDITEDFVAANRALFLEIIKGGEDAAAAYDELAWRAIASAQNMTLEAFMQGESTAAVYQLINQIIADARANSGVIDFSLYTQQINDLGSAATIAQQALSSFFTTFTNNEGNTIGTINDYSSLFGGKTTEKEEPWENPYDKFYNTTEKINEALRQREKLERRYQKLLDSGEATTDKLVQNAKEELAVLAREAELQNKMISNREWQINQYISEKGLTQYAYLGENEFTGQSELRINWGEINKIPNQEKGEEVEEYISQLEEWFSSIEEAQDSLEEIEDAVDEIKKRGEDEYFDLENKIKDAVVQYYQDQIDELDAINTSINDTNSKLIDAMQESISKQRQARDNEKTEEELSDKQRRLMYLQQDTSGGNDLEILKLQKELEQDQEDYTDTLIDYKISELQEQNNKAAEQRQQQIDIANEQLKHWQDTGDVWNKVYALMGAGIDPISGKIIDESQLQTLLKNSDNFTGMSTLGKMDWLDKLEGNVAQAVSYLKTGRQLENMEEYLGKAGQKVTFTTADGATLTGVTDKHGNVKVGNQTYSGVYQNFDGNFRTDETTKKQETPQKVGNNKDEESQTGPAYSETKTETPPEEAGLQHGLTAEQIKQLQTALKKYGYYKADVDGKYGPGTQKAVQDYWKEEYKIGKKGTEGAETLTSIQNTSYGLLTGKSEAQAKRNIRVTKTQKGNYPTWDGKGAPFINPVVSVDEGGIPWLDDKIIGSRKKGKLGNVIYGGKVYPIDRFKTGGLADYTGPAWLDGTKSKPEIVLNAQDTKNFIQLKDVLASLMSRPMQTSENSGDNTYDIDINVESIGSDYDVEQLATKIKNMINQDARYRNNNTINFMR